MQRAVDRANKTRGVIRLPLGSRSKMAIAVADLDGTLLGLFRMLDAASSSNDVSVAKARNVIYFSSVDKDPRDLPGIPAGTAVTNRSIGFRAQPFFPSGINNSQPGPFFELFGFDQRKSVHAGAAGEEREPERDRVFSGGVGAVVSQWGDGGWAGSLRPRRGAGRLRDGGGGAGV